MVEQGATHTPIGIVLCDDLIFTSRVTATARSLGLTVKSARSVEVLKTLAQSQTPRCLIVDLSNPGLDIAELNCWLTVLAGPKPRVIAYGSHVDTATLRAAREAGCDEVMPRSKFVEELPARLVEWMEPVV
jgi:CheY-like chemotaxis protein